MTICTNCGKRESEAWLPSTGCPECKPFELRNDPPAHVPAKFDDQHANRQRVLVDGMECLPGQMDLFD